MVNVKQSVCTCVCALKYCKTSFYCSNNYFSRLKHFKLLGVLSYSTLCMCWMLAWCAVHECVKFFYPFVIVMPFRAVHVSVCVHDHILKFVNVTS